MCKFHYEPDKKVYEDIKKVLIKAIISNLVMRLVRFI